jgi:choline kinase
MEMPFDAIGYGLEAVVKVLRDFGWVVKYEDYEIEAYLPHIPDKFQIIRYNEAKRKFDIFICWEASDNADFDNCLALCDPAFNHHLALVNQKLKELYP